MRIMYLREFVKNKLPKLAFIFSLIKTNCLRNNELFKSNLTQSKGSRIAKLGRLFFTNSLMKVLLVKSAITIITNVTTSNRVA